MNLMKRRHASRNKLGGLSVSSPIAGCGAILLAGLAYATVGSASATVVFVDAGATGADNGSEWGDAFVDLQAALTQAANDSNVEAIWVAAGTYRPGASGDPATATFGLINGVTLVGGLAGDEDPLTFDLDDRDFLANETILSGDLNENDGADFANMDDNVYRVVTALDNDATAVIDGFTIAGGNARSGGPVGGGGMASRNPGGATIRNCVFRENKAEHGGGLAVENSNSPLIQNCTFVGNWGVQQGGGADVDGTDHSIVIRNCRFIGNFSPHGAGLSARRNVAVANTVFIGNDAGGGDGGGMYVFAIGNYFQMTNCTLSGNSAGEGGAVYNSSYASDPGTTNYANCILWGNAAPDGPEVFTLYGTPLFHHCDIQGSSGSGNIDADPLFADADLRLPCASPCIDAGDNAAVPDGIDTDLDGNCRIQGGVVDMGAYEFQIDSDGDGDGVPDCDDACPDSDLSPTIVVDGNDSGVENDLLDDGCTLTDLIDELLAQDASMQDIVLFLVDLKHDEIITGQEMGAILQSLNGP